MPKPIKLVKGGRASGYLESEIDDWINNRVEEARGNASK
jgi:predicted DNA-binding transcriptional regulator AlpA